MCWPKSIFSDATLAISISCIVPDGDSVGHCILFQTACWAPLCFGTADIFQKQLCCSGVWRDLYISLTCLTGMEWGLIDYDQIMIPVKAKEGLFPLASWGPGLASVWILVFWDTCTKKPNENAKCYLVEGVCVVRIPLAGEENVF